MEDRYRPNEARKRAGKPRVTAAAKAPKKAKGITDYFASESDDPESAPKAHTAPFDIDDPDIDHKHEEEKKSK